jgi:hypothetical protein
MAGMLITNYDFSKTFLWNARSQKVTYTNPSGSPATLPKGRLMGRIAASQKALPHVSTAVDGSEQPIGVLGDEYTVAGSATVVLTIFDGGDVAVEQIVLGGSDTMATLVGTVSIRDLIARNTQLKPIQRTELSGYDNQ